MDPKPVASLDYIDKWNWIVGNRSIPMPVRIQTLDCRIQQGAFTIPKAVENFLGTFKTSFDLCLSCHSLLGRTTQERKEDLGLLKEAIIVILKTTTMTDDQKRLFLGELLSRAIEKSQEEVAIRLLKIMNKNSFTIDCEEYIFKAYEKKLITFLKEVIELKLLLQVYIDIGNARFQLHLACEHGILEIIPKLLKVSSIKPDNFGNTALHYACKSGNWKIVQMLFSKSNANDGCMLPNLEGQTPLHMVCGTNADAIVNLFSKKECDPFREDKNQRIPFEYACEKGDLAVAKALYQLMIRDAQALAKAKSHLPKALSLACQHGFLDIVKYLVEELNADINQEVENILPLTMAFLNHTDKDDLVLYLLGRKDLNMEHWIDKG